MELGNIILGVGKNRARRIFQVLTAALAIPLTVLSFGESPRFGLLWTEKTAAVHPFPDWWEDAHRYIGQSTIIAICLGSIAANARRHNEHPAKGYWTLVCCVVAVAIVLGQIAWCTLVYSTHLNVRPETGPGLWLLAPTAFSVLVGE